MEDNTTPTQININDLITLRDIVDLACSRGAFRGNEMKSVGEIFDKLTSFLDAVIVSAQTDADQKGEVQ